MESFVNIILQKFNSKMSKQVLNKRPASTSAGFKAGNSYKENEMFDSYQLDPKIAELKKKYQLDKPQSNLTYVGHRPPTALRQQQVFKKLENIKSQLLSIPDWQNMARSILFDDPNKYKETIHIFQPSRVLPTFSSKHGFDAKRMPDESCEESKILDSSNISFKINHAKSIEKMDEKLQPYFNDAILYTPAKTTSQFKYDKYRDHTQTKKPNQGLDEKNNKVDEKISQISRKIKQSELKKKSLGVQFVPFQKKASLRKYESPHYDIECNYKSKTPQYLGKKNSASIQKLYIKPSKQDDISKFNQSFLNNKIIKEQLQMYSPRFAPIPTPYQKTIEKSVLQKKNTPNYEVEVNSNQEEEDKYKMKKNRSYSVYEKMQANTRHFEINYKNQIEQNQKSRSIVQKAEEAIKERKKKIENVSEKKRSKENTLKLVQAFCQQVKLDQKFRNCKLWFKANKNEKKLGRLKSILDYEGLRLEEEKINQEFSVEEKEDNPFFSVSSQSCDIEQVARSYLDCEKNWRKNLYKRFNKNALQHEDFNSLSIDLDKKGYIVLEDLVRWLNMETGTFFRNRDLFTIFKRMSSNSEKLNFNAFINTFYA